MIIEQKNKITGFSLIEMIVAVSIFSLIVAAAITSFVSMVNSDKKAQQIQKNTEDARYAMDKIAKSLRTSTIIGCLVSNGDYISGIDPNTGNPVPNGDSITVNNTNACGKSDGVRVYDFSQGECIDYIFQLVSGQPTIHSREMPVDPSNWQGICTTSYNFIDQLGNTANFSNLVDSDVTGSFYVVPSTENVGSGGHNGQVTITMKTCTTKCDGTDDTGDFQTTVSLRDYEEVNPTL